jgi:FkbM family methyltransferase
MSETVDAVETLEVRGRRFAYAAHPLMAGAAAEFAGESEAGTLDFFDAVLPGCDRLVDVGAHAGLMALYGATHGVAVTAFEPNPDTRRLLAANLAANMAANPDLAARIAVVPAALGATDGVATLYAKAAADSGSSLFRTVWRAGPVDGSAVGTVAVRDAAAALRECGTDRRTLVKIDAEGAEYAILPAVASLLAERLPFLHVSFHPFNVMRGADAYVNACASLAAGLAAAEALAVYPFMYVRTRDGWRRFDAADRLDLLRRYLLVPKPVPRTDAPQYGFTDAWGFSAVPLAALGG